MLALVVVLLLLILIVANRADKSVSLRPVIYFLLLLINGGLLIVYGFTPIIRATQGQTLGAITISMANAEVGLAIAALFALVATLLLFERVRRPLTRIFPRAATGEGDSIHSSGFDPASITHMIAMVYCIYLLAETILEFVLAGGLSGLTDQLKASNAGGLSLLTPSSVLEQLAIWVGVATFGAGLFTRRSWADVRRRLGLRWPTVQELWISLAMSGGLIVFAFIVGIIWQIITPPNTYNQQTQLSQLIAGGVNTLSFAFLIAFCAAVGEEIAFRGALQPIFGLWPTAIFFALTHVQYTLTPATLLIVGRRPTSGDSPSLRRVAGPNLWPRHRLLFMR